MKKRTRENS